MNIITVRDFISHDFDSTEEILLDPIKHFYYKAILASP